MAISKILYIKDCGSSYNGKHLKQAINYITVKEKTSNGRFIAGLNCQPEFAYEQMKETKEKFGKVGGRQGYHLIISFEEGEVDAQTAFEIVGRCAKEYLGNGYEAVYSVHNNTDHIHGHILFNSVNFQTGRKYRYEKGDWAREIQPITNRLCQEYGLSTIKISEDLEKPMQSYKEWNDYRDGAYVWSDMIRRDLDACILKATTFDSFLGLLSEKGYEIKQGGKHLAIKPQGMMRFKRCKALGEDYTEERIKERILTEALATGRHLEKTGTPRIVYCKVKRFKRAKLTRIQKKYYERLYRIGKLKKRPYSQVWQYRDEIRKMKKIQEQYLFLMRYDVGSKEELRDISERFAESKEEISNEKSRTFKARDKCQSLFDIATEMEDLKEAERSFVLGDTFFQEEYEKYHLLAEQLRREGYQFGEVLELKEHYRNEIAQIKEKETILASELSTVKAIMKEILEDQKEQQKQSKTNEIQESKTTQVTKTTLEAKATQEAETTQVTKITKETQITEERKIEEQPRR